MRLILLITVILSKLFSLSEALIKENVKFLENIDKNQLEVDEYSPFTPTSSLEVSLDLKDLNPVKNSLEISTLTNQFTHVLTETKKPILRNLPQDQKCLEIRKKFKDPAKMHINYYLNSQL